MGGMIATALGLESAGSGRPCAARRGGNSDASHEEREKKTHDDGQYSHHQYTHTAMDVFQIRLDFLALLKRLNASQQSMQKTLAFADRNVKASGDIWDCILAEAAKVSGRAPT